jgi:hypothetical protein
VTCSTPFLVYIHSPQKAQKTQKVIFLDGSLRVLRAPR